MSASGEPHPPAGAPSLVTIRAGSDAAPPLLCVHAASGEVSLYQELADLLAPGRAVLGLCAPAAAGGDGFGGDALAAGGLEALAAEHVRAIGRAGLRAPYLLAGECSGGALAYEIARQLAQAGEDVGLLALIDALPGARPALARHMPALAYRVLHRGRILGHHVLNLVRLGGPDRRSYAAVKARRARRSAAARVSALAGARPAGAAQGERFRRALASYAPGPYPGRAVLFRSSTLPLGMREPADLGWAALVEDLAIEVIPGYFTTPISQPGVRVLAERLSRRLPDRPPPER